jgi:MFS transporter, ACS family, tartrate transporter
MDRTLERSTMRKVYLRLLPFAVLSFVLAYIDRINVSFAGLTMRGDLGMTSGTFGFAVGMFYWGISFSRFQATSSWKRSAREYGLPGS